MEMDVGARGEFGQEPPLRLRTPETLRERGREELTGTKGRELVFQRASGAGDWVSSEVDVVMSTADGVVGGTRICDDDIGVTSGVSISAWS